MPRPTAHVLPESIGKRDMHVMCRREDIRRTDTCQLEICLSEGERVGGLFCLFVPEVSVPVWCKRGRGRMCLGEKKKGEHPCPAIRRGTFGEIVSVGQQKKNRIE